MPSPPAASASLRKRVVPAMPSSRKAMDGNNRRPTQGEPSMDGGDWRTRLLLDSRLRIVNKIMETLKRHLPIPGPEGLVELRKIAVRFEEKIYTTATSQSDYLRKIALKMLTMETRSQGGVNYTLPSNPVGNQNPLDAAAGSAMKSGGRVHVTKKRKRGRTEGEGKLNKRNK